MKAYCSALLEYKFSLKVAEIEECLEEKINYKSKQDK